MIENSNENNNDSTLELEEKGEIGTRNNPIDEENEDPPAANSQKEFVSHHAAASTDESQGLLPEIIKIIKNKF